MLDTLFDFQLEDVKKLSEARSVLIGSEMGTGKTYEGIALDLEHRAANEWPYQRTLVVAPMTVLSTWEDHFKDLTDLKVVTVNPKARANSFDEFTSGQAHVFLVHWEALRLMPELKDVYWLHIVADECHRAKNRKAQQTRALKQLKAFYRTAMSGTPVVNRPDELWSILNWLYPEQYRGFWAFFNHYVDSEVVYPGGYQKIKGPKNVKQLQEKIGPYYVRHLKKGPCCERHPQGVMSYLPDKYYTPLWVNLDPKQRRAYDMMRKDLIAWVGAHEDQALVAPVVIAQLIRLQQFAAGYMEEDGDGGWRLSEPSSKLDALMQILEDNPDEQIVVFSQFKQLVRLVKPRLEKAKIPYVELTGDISQKVRGENVRRFQSGDARVFVGTIAAGGVGITLTASSTVVFLDRSWSPALNLQAEDRLHRYGQENAVQVVDVMARKTVDLGRKQRLEEKWSWIRELLGA